jgi:hypothetical protein
MIWTLRYTLRRRNTRTYSYTTLPFLRFSNHPPLAANLFPHTQMPLLVNKLIFSLVPARAPFFIRPLLWMVFGQLDKQMLMPQIGKNRDMVGPFIS